MKVLICIQELKSEFIFILSFRFNRYFSNKLKEAMLNPYKFCLAIKRAWERQSNAFDRSVRTESRIFLLSIADFYFFNLDITRCWPLNPFLNPHWYFDE